MAITIEANYSKKLGLPEYSSHQYSVTVRTEVSDLSQIEAESSRLYGLLQTSVDTEIQNPGWLPGNDPMRAQVAQVRPVFRRNGSDDDAWQCSGAQKKLILEIVEEHSLDRHEVDELAQRLFGQGVKQLNKLQASALIDELFASHVPHGRQRGNKKHRSFQRQSGRAG